MFLGLCYSSTQSRMLTAKHKNIFCRKQTACISSELLTASFGTYKQAGNAQMCHTMPGGSVCLNSELKHSFLLATLGGLFLFFYLITYSFFAS
jgi:hypothetical protein